jgi:lipid-A-disaccharide synthase
VDAPAESVLKWADLALVASGTATLETALVGTPGVLFYRVAKGTEIIFRMITPYRDFIGLPNVILKREVVPEFVQQNFSAQKMFPVVQRLIEDSSYRSEQKARLVELRRLLESTQLGSRPSEVVAKRVNGFLKQKNLLEGSRLLIEPTLT